MTEKLKVSRAIADALNHMPVGLSVSEILKLHVNNPYGWCNESKPLTDLKLEELATALIVGYEVEMTPHEEIAKGYNEYFVGEDKYCEGYADGIEFTLNTLGIIVKGVNDK